MPDIKGTDKQVISAGMHRPVCVKCKRELYPHKNGMGLLDIVRGEPYALWDTDVWKCPECGMEVVGGFASSPISAHYENNFSSMVSIYRRRDLLVEVHHT